MRIVRASLLGSLVGSMVFGLGCTPDGGVIVGTGGGTGGVTTTPTTAGGGSSTDVTTTPTGGTGTGGTSTGGTTTTAATGGGGDTGGTTTSFTTSGTGGTGGIVMIEDEDQDGWSIADGDCCDSFFAACSDVPYLVNPGALELPGNQIDDDCNPATLDNAPFPTCSTAIQANMDLQNGAILGTTKLVKAMDLCQFTTEAPPLSQKTWGIISTKLVLADGSEVDQPKNVQIGVLPDFGPNVQPQYGETMAAISSGTARREGDPGFVHPKSGLAPGQIGSYDAGTSCPAPPSYVAANGGKLPSLCADCMGPGQDCTTSFDSVSLRVRIRPPTNAKGFSYRLLFYSSEYPQYVCQQYNDFFLALISENVAPLIPPDGNVAFDADEQPISVNNSLFSVCSPQPGYPCMGGVLELIGNGWGGWNGAIDNGGATGWLENEVPLTLKDPPQGPGGEQIPTADPVELEFIIWDAGDHHVDSLILLDRFRWSLQMVTLGTHHK